MSAGRRRLPLVLAAALGLSACQPGAGPGGGVPTLEVTRSEAFVRRVTAEGYLRAVEATPLNAPQDARGPMKIAWVAEDGTRVAEADSVVRFDSSEMERLLKDSQDDVTTAEQQIKRERALGTTSGRKRDRTASLARKEAKIAREFQSDDDEILSRNDIIESNIDVDFAEAKSSHASEVKGIERAVSRSQVDLYDIDRRHSLSEVKRAKDGLEKLEIKAPHAGILVLERDWRGNTLRIGDSIWPGQKVAELPLVAKMEAEVFVLEADAGDLAAELRAELTIEAHPGEVHEAKIKRVDTLAKPRHHEVPVQYFGVTLELSETDQELMKVGQRVRAVIYIEQGEAIVVPRQAVFERDGKSVVFRRDGLGWEEAAVELGSSSAGRVVVTAGLEPGDEIALRDPNRAANELLGKDSDAAAGNGMAKPGAMK